MKIYTCNDLTMVLELRWYYNWMKTIKEQIKQIQYLVAYLAKSDEAPHSLYTTMESALVEAGLHTETSFTCKQIATLMKNHTTLKVKNYKDATTELLKLRKILLPEKLQKQKQYILATLLRANFPSHYQVLDDGLDAFEASLTPVEAKMYKLIASYIASITEGLDIFVALDGEKLSDFESIKSFAINLHVKSMELLFYEEEREIIAPSLEKATIVYVGVYYHICYLAKEDSPKA